VAAADNGALVRRAVEAIWNRGELEAADRLFAAGYVNHGGLIPDLVRGPEAVKLAAALFRAAFPRLHVTVEDVLADGATVALRWTARGGGDALEGTTFGRVAGGKVAESWTYWDTGRLSTAAPGRAGGVR
jgi:predicted SnoaL-like aldol condensation-catalyzing enzyme